jgi:putative redox protein
MAKRKVTVSMKADHEYEAVNEQGNKVQIDMYDADRKQAQSPMDLLLSALGSCAAVDAVSMMKKKRRTVTDFFVELEGTRNDGIPAYYTSISLKFILISPDATEEEFAKVVTLSVEKYCSVSSSLKSQINYSSEVRKEK